MTTLILAGLVAPLVVGVYRRFRRPAAVAIRPPVNLDRESALQALRRDFAGKRLSDVYARINSREFAFAFSEVRSQAKPPTREEIDLLYEFASKRKQEVQAQRQQAIKAYGRDQTYHLVMLARSVLLTM